MFDVLYGKYWYYTKRQWTNVGIQFEKGSSGVNAAWALSAIEEGGNIFGYLMMFVQIITLKQRMLAGDWWITRGLHPELIYDRLMYRSCKLPISMRTEDNKLKPNIIKQPYTHLLNCVNRWIADIIWAANQDDNRYNARVEQNDKQTVLVDNNTLSALIDDVKIGQWAVAFPEDWICFYDLIDNVNEAEEASKETEI